MLSRKPVLDRKKRSKFVPNTKTGSQKSKNNTTGPTENVLEMEDLVVIPADNLHLVSEDASLPSIEQLLAPSDDDINVIFNSDGYQPSSSSIVPDTFRQNSVQQTKQVQATTSRSFALEMSKQYRPNIPVSNAFLEDSFVHPTVAASLSAAKKRTYPFTSSKQSHSKKQRAFAATQLLIRSNGAAFSSASSSDATSSSLLPVALPLRDSSSLPFRSYGTVASGARCMTDSGKEKISNRYQLAVKPGDIGSYSSSESRHLSAPEVNKEGITYTYLTVYLKKRKSGLGIRLINQKGRAVVVGFSAEYQQYNMHANPGGKPNDKEIRIGDIIVAVENLDCSDASKVPFSKVVKHLSNAGGYRPAPLGVAHPHHVSSTACVWDEDPLNFSHRTSRLARYNDTICVKLARPSDILQAISEGSSETAGKHRNTHDTGHSSGSKGGGRGGGGSRGGRGSRGGETRKKRSTDKEVYARGTQGGEGDGTSPSGLQRETSGTSGMEELLDTGDILAQHEI